jgi:hypothetical protein
VKHPVYYKILHGPYNILPFFSFSLSLSSFKKTPKLVLQTFLKMFPEKVLNISQ